MTETKLKRFFASFFAGHGTPDHLCAVLPRPVARDDGNQNLSQTPMLNRPRCRQISARRRCYPRDMSRLTWRWPPTDAFIFLSASLPAASSNTIFDRRQSPGPFRTGCCHAAPAPAARSRPGAESRWLTGQQPGQVVVRSGKLAATVQTLRPCHASNLAAT